jgi:hypothetical protein
MGTRSTSSVTARLGVWTACVAAAAVLTACGGDGGGGTTTSATLSGVAATGAPIAGGTVTIRCATGSALTATTSSAGAWTVTTSGQTLPCALQVSGGNLPSGTTYHSVTTTFGNVNITPLTDLIVARLGASSPAQWFSAPVFNTITDSTLDQARTAVVTALGLSTALGNRNPLAAAFKAESGDPIDDILEAIRSVLSGTEGGYGGLLAASVRGDFSAFAGFPAAFTVALGGADCTGTRLTYTQGQAGGPFSNGQQVCVLASINPATLTLDGRTFTNPVQNTVVQAPFAAYAFADGGVQYEVVLEGSRVHEINVLSGSTFVGQLAGDAGGGSGGAGSLTVQVNASGVAAPEITIDDVPAPATEAEFCSDMTDPNSDTSLANVVQGVVGSFRIDSCSFRGNQGVVNATVSITSPVAASIPYVVTYTFN